MSNILYMAKQTWKVKLGRQIRAARERRGMSQDELAASVRKIRGSITSYENGNGNPGFEVIARIASELQADFTILGCRVVAKELLEPQPDKKEEQLELKFDQDHTILASVTIRPTRKSLTITAHSDYRVKSA